MSLRQWRVITPESPLLGSFESENAPLAEFPVTETFAPPSVRIADDTLEAAGWHIGGLRFFRPTLRRQISAEPLVLICRLGLIDVVSCSVIERLAI